MKYLYAVIISVTFLLTGCLDGYNPEKCYNNVRRAYPDSDITIIPGEKYKFIIRRPNQEVLYVETMSASTPEVTLSAVVFPPVR